MATIAFIFDIEEGHLFPSFRLAQSLENAGHRVIYLSIPDNEEFIRNDGFEFYPIFSAYYPKGYRAKYKQLKKINGYERVLNVKDHIDEVFNGSFGTMLMKLNPDLLVMSSFLAIEGLILYYQLKLTAVIFRVYFRDPGSTISDDCIQGLMSLEGETALKLFDLTNSLGFKLTSFAGLVKPLTEFPEFVICSSEFEMGHVAQNDNIFYIGSDVDQRKHSGDLFFLEHVIGKKPIIYASMGSQAVAYGRMFQMFFEKLVSVMTRDSMKDLHLVISIGAENDEKKFSTTCKNITVVKWISQLDMLSVASLAIIHGGLGGIKECIYRNVPMIIMPVTHDQPANGKRVEYHKLGVYSDIENTTEDELTDKIRYVLTDKEIKSGIIRMKKKFTTLDRENVGVKVIERLVARKM